jgi:hypothetical protein
MMAEYKQFWLKAEALRRGQSFESKEMEIIVYYDAFRLARLY